MHIYVKNNGVTLVILAIVIIVLMIIVGVSLNSGLSSADEVADDRTGTELSIVEQAVIEQYTLLLTENQDGKIATKILEDVSLEDDTDRPSTLIGTRIANVSTLNSYGFNQYLVDYSNIDDMKYEDYYYFLDESDLEELGISDNKSDEEIQNHSYIVNYSTGEVFDTKNKKYYTSKDPIYLDGTNSKINTETYNFTDE